jgi:glycerate 2-kinase
MTDVRRVEDIGAPPTILRRMFEAAVRAASPSLCVPPWLPRPPSGRAVVVGGGKAAAAMAAAVESCWTGDLSGLVVTPTLTNVNDFRAVLIEKACRHLGQ